MTCPRCGSEIADNLNFCTECGAPVNVAPVNAAPQPQNVQPQNVQPQNIQPQNVAPQNVRPQNVPPMNAQPQTGAQPAKKKSNVGLIVLIVVVAVLAVIITAVAILVHRIKEAAQATPPKDYLEGLQFEYEEPEDIDMDSLNEAVENLGNLDLTADVDVDLDTPEVPELPDLSEDEEFEDAAKTHEPAGDKTVYSFADVYRNGNELTVVPNGGLDGSEVFDPRHQQGD